MNPTKGLRRTANRHNSKRATRKTVKPMNKETSHDIADAPLPKIYDERLAEDLVRAGFIDSKEQIYKPISPEERRLIEERKSKIRSRWALNKDCDD